MLSAVFDWLVMLNKVGRDELISSQEFSASRLGWDDFQIQFSEV